MRALLALVLVLTGCGSAAGLPQDAGAPDAAVDAGDAGSDAGVADAGNSDAGTGDAGPSDAGTSDGGSDAGAVDAGAPDAGPVDSSVPGIPCTDSLANVYLTPTNLPAMTLADRGDVVRCAPDAVLSVADVNTQLAGKGVVGVTAVTGSNSYRIAYRTFRANGVAGVGTARVFLPDVPRQAPGPLPIIVSDHGSDGLAQACAPSMDPTGNAELSMPFAGTGYAVIAPDYAGLGNGGAQGYLDNQDTGHSALDAARALRKLVPGAFSSQIIFIGHSQGGGAALSAQALASTYGADGEVAGVIVFAAEWQSRLNSFGYIDALNNPGGLTIADGVAKPPIYVMRQYAYQINDVGDASGGDGFPAAKASELVTDVQTQCLTALGGIVQADGPYLRDLVDPALSAGVLACVSGAGAGSGCAGTGQAFYNYLTNNIVTGDPNGAPVVYVQGLADIIMPPAQEAACNIAKLEADGVPTQICVDAAAQHTNVVQRNAAYALSWVAATLDGMPLPSCTSTGLPACSP